MAAECKGCRFYNTLFFSKEKPAEKGECLQQPMAYLGLDANKRALWEHPIVSGTDSCKFHSDALVVVKPPDLSVAKPPSPEKPKTTASAVLIEKQE